MAASKGKCFDPRTDSKVKTPEENGKSVIFLNSQGATVLLVHADRYCRKGRSDCTDCFFEKDQKVADYIVSKPGIVDVIVELKGTDVMAAVEQIEATIRTWNVHERCTGKIGALIVSSKGGAHPKVVAKFLIKQEQFKKRGIKLRRVTDPSPTFEFPAFV
ncbi:MAG TPA: hypothetical protein VHX20_04645 [Terracidiphilus sp.]|jgi:hypothetical protein|nr:hypothetical protein [Terracidiphilus sp.]